MTGACMRASPVNSTNSTSIWPGAGVPCSKADANGLTEDGLPACGPYCWWILCWHTSQKTATTAKEKFNKLQYVSLAGAPDRQ